MRRRCAVIFALLTVAASAAAQPDLPDVQVDANIPPARLWTHHLTFPESVDGVRSMVFAPDGEHIYVHYVVPVIDPWLVMVSHWPEALGAVLLMLLLIPLLAVRRVLRRPQARGAPHCRRCNYDLSAHVGRWERGRFVSPEGVKCPECGVVLAKRRPVRGRRPRARLAAPVGVWLVLLIGYTVMMTAGPPRTGRASEWFDWSSSELAVWASRHRMFRGEVLPGIRLVRVNAADGTTGRVITTTRASVDNSIAISPDGNSIAVSLGERGILTLLDSRTGRARATLSPRVKSFPPWPFERFLGFTPDGEEVVVIGDGRVSIWSPRTGELRALSIGRTDDPRGWIPPQYGELIVAPEADLLMHCGPEFAVYHLWRLSELQSGGTTESRLNRMRIESRLMYDPIVSSDATRMFAYDGRGNLLDIDLRNEVQSPPLSIGSARFTKARLALVDNSFLLVGTTEPSLLVRDVSRRAWVARLSLPSGAYQPVPITTPTRQWAAASVQTGDGNSVPFRHTLVIWDLQQILEPSSPISDSSSPPTEDPP